MSGASGDQAGPVESATSRVVLVLGPARSGADELARALQLFGLRTPDADPAGAAPHESHWVRDFHDRLLAQANVRVGDARPQAWFETGKFATHEQTRRELFDWLGSQATPPPHEMVIADPRLSWFLGLWKAATLRCRIDTGHVVMLRAPGESIGIKGGKAGGQTNQTARAAGWLNQMLHAERATRGAHRTFLRHRDLLDDWTVPLYRLGERFSLEGVHNATAGEIRRVHDLIDPRPAPAPDWSGVDLPKPLRLIIDETWDQLDKLVESDEESPTVLQALDGLRREYAELYAEAEQLAHSTIVAARRRKPARPKNDEPPATVEAHAAPVRRRGLGRRGRR